MGVKLRKRNSAWWVFIDYHGKRKAKKVGSREAAEAVKRKLEARLAEGDLGCLEERTVPVFRDYSERWLKEYAELECKASTVGFYRQCLKLHVEPKFGELRLDAITRDQVKAWIASLCEEGYARNTVRLAVTTLRTILNAAREDGLIATNPADKLGRFVKTEKPPQEATALTREETQALLDKAKEACSVRDYALVLCALRAGLRRGELVALRWGDCQFGAGEDDPNRFILVQRNFDHRWARDFTSTKSKKPRRVDMSKELRKVLLGLRDERFLEAFAQGKASLTDELVFPSEAGTPLEINNFVARTFEPLLEQAGLRHIRFHDLRHTYGSLLIQAGASLPYVQRQMGHASVQITADTYIHLLPGGDIAFTDKLDSLSTARKDRNVGEGEAASRGKSLETSRQLSATQAQPARDGEEGEAEQVFGNEWLGGRDSNPDTQIQSLQSYR